MNTRESILKIAEAMNAAIIGQETVVERLLIAVLANGHVLMEGLPGTAKTRSIKTLGKLVESQFSRVQFTPDLLPSDVTGSEPDSDQTAIRRDARHPVLHDPASISSGNTVYFGNNSLTVNCAVQSGANRGPSTFEYAASR